MWPRWLNGDTLDAAVVAEALALGCRGVSVEWQAIDDGAMAIARTAGLEVAAWTVRRRATYDRLDAPGCRGDLRRRPPPSTGSAARDARPAAERPRLCCPDTFAEDPRWRNAPISSSSGPGRSEAGRRSSQRPRGSGGSSSSMRGLAGTGASSRAAGIVRAQGGTPATVALGRWSIDFYNGQQAAYGTDSGFRELGYLILAVTEEDERAGRERVAMQQAEGLGVRWLDAAEAAATAVTLSPDGHRGGSFIETDGAIDPPRNVRAYGLAMQRTGVELRERTTFTGIRTTPTADGTKVTAVETDAGSSRPSGSC